MSVVVAVPWSTWLLQVAARPDTAITKVVVQRTGWETFADIEQAIVPLLLIILLAALAIAIFKVSRGVGELTRRLKESTSDISGAVHSVRNVAEDVRSITSTVKGDVEAVGDTMRTVNDRVREAVAAAERRVRRFDALVDVAQEEIEDFVVSTAATLRGVRQGASVLRRSFGFSRNNGLSRGRRRRARERAILERERDLEDDEQPRIRTRVPDET